MGEAVLEGLADGGEADYRRKADSGAEQAEDSCKPSRQLFGAAVEAQRIAIFGLGYVGSVSAACFANSGHHVIGVDPQGAKVDLINRGKAPVIEAGLEDLLKKARLRKTIRATQDAETAVRESDMSIVCVGTPSSSNGSLDLRHVTSACEQIGLALRTHEDHHIVVLRSTVLPGTMKGLVIPTLERASGKKAGIDFGVATNPEFLRESTAVDDFHNPPKIVIGSLDETSAKLVDALYAEIDAQHILTSIEVAEMVKYADNAWHATKVAFANEIGNICKEMRIDSHAVMNIFCQDTVLNLSPYYLQPGYAFGGSCLPKDLRALTYKARTLDVPVPLLESVMLSNNNQVERAVRCIIDKGARKIGILGFSFKAGTDDLRESPLVELIERLLGKGYSLKLFDPNVSMARLLGANREYIQKMIPHICSLMTDSIDEVIDFSELIVIGTCDSAFAKIAGRLKAGQQVVDMVRIPELQAMGNGYDGINW
jgi:GDP-mannose 6-dehydrogenase